MGNVIKSAKTSIRVVYGLVKIVGGDKLNPILDPIASKIKNSYRNFRDIIKHPIASYINYLDNKGLKNSGFDPWEVADHCIDCERNKYQLL